MMEKNKKNEYKKNLEKTGSGKELPGAPGWKWLKTSLLKNGPYRGEDENGGEGNYILFQSTKG